MTMMTVWIVLKNDKVDEVFYSEEAALLHKKNLTKKWNLTEIISKEVKLL